MKAAYLTGHGGIEVVAGDLERLLEAPAPA